MNMEDLISELGSLKYLAHPLFIVGLSGALLSRKLCVLLLKKEEVDGRASL